MLARTEQTTETLMTRPEAAEYLNVRVGTLEVWASTHRYPLPFYRIGRAVRYKRADLDRFIASRAVGTEAAR